MRVMNVTRKGSGLYTITVRDEDGEVHVVEMGEHLSCPGLERKGCPKGYHPPSWRAGRSDRACVAMEWVARRILDDTSREITHHVIDNFDTLPSTCAVCLKLNSPVRLHDLDFVLCEKGLHPFHEGCITKWLQIKDTCPICREVASFDGLMVSLLFL
jgi:hypothetical protein